MTGGSLYVYDTLFQRLAQDLQGVTAARQLCLQPAHAVGRPRLFALGCGIAVPHRDGDVCMPPLGPNTPATRGCQACSAGA
jgi:hypothetical protein